LWFLVPGILEAQKSPLSAFLPHLRAGLIPKGRPREGQITTGTDFEIRFISLMGISYCRRELQDNEHLVGQLRTAWPGIFQWMVYLSACLPLESNQLPFHRTMADTISAVFYAYSDIRPLNQLVVSTPGSVELATRIWIDTPFDGDFSTIIPYYRSMAGFMGLLSAGDLPRTFAQRIVGIKGYNASMIAEMVMTRISLAAGQDKVDDRYLTPLVNMLHHCSSMPTISEALLNHKSVATITKVARRLSHLSLSKDSDHAQSLVIPGFVCLAYLADNLEGGDGITPICQSIENGLLSTWNICSNHLHLPLPEHVKATSIIKIISDIIPRYLTYRSTIEAADKFLREQYIPSASLQNSPMKGPWERFMQLFVIQKAWMLQSPLVKKGCSNTVCLYFFIAMIVALMLRMQLCNEEPRNRVQEVFGVWG
jgi:hypothetical protein